MTDRRYGRLRAALVGVIWSALAFTAFAQQDAGSITIEEVQAKLVELEASTAENKAKLLETYRAVLESLKLAQDARARAQSFAPEIAEAPLMLQALKEELAAPPVEPELVASADLSLQEIVGKAELATAELTAARAQVSSLEALGRQRSERGAVLPDELAAAKQALVTARETLSATAEGVEHDPRRMLHTVIVEQRVQELAALETEREHLTVRNELLPLRRDRWARRVILAEKVATFWTKLAEARRTAAGEAGAVEAKKQLESIEERFPFLEPFAKRNRQLAGQRSGETGLPQRIIRARSDLELTRATMIELDQRYLGAKKRIDVGGVTESAGILLRRDYEWLPTARDVRQPAELLEGKLAEAQLEFIDVEDLVPPRDDLAVEVERALSALGVEDRSDALIEATRDLMSARRVVLASIHSELKTLGEILLEHQAIRAQLIKRTDEYRAFIEKRILWVRNTPRDPRVSLDALEVYLDEGGELPSLEAVSMELSQAGERRPVLLFVLVSLFLTYIFTRKPAKRKRTELAGHVRSYKTDKYIYTVQALLLSLWLALPLPLVFWALGALLSDSADDFTRALGLGLREIAMGWVCLRFCHQLTKPKGVGQAHFKWPAHGLEVVARELRWFEPVAIPLGLVALTLDRQQNPVFSDTVGRLAFIAVMVASSVFYFRLLRPHGGFWSIDAKTEKGLLLRTHRVWSFVAWMTPLILGVATGLGFYYTALQFELRLRYSFLLGLSLVIANAMLLRWLFIARRRLAVTQALDARARREDPDEPHLTESSSSTVEDEKVNIPAVDARTRRLFQSSLSLATMVGLYFVWASVLPALQGLDRVQIFPELAILEEAAYETEESTVQALTAPVASGNGTSSVSSSFAGMPVDTGASTEGVSQGLPSSLTLANLLLAAILLLLTTIVAKNLPALLELSLLTRLPLDSGARYAVATLARYLILLIGLSGVSGALGVGWSQVQWLAAALTFGLAFGLQEIFANFASGLIILVERPIRVGDIVTVGDVEGRVTQLRMRATTILDWDRREYLIPNKNLITGNVINWTLSDPTSRLVIPVGIAYGSDTELARRLLLKVARECSNILDDPAPQAIFRGFGESSLDFQLRVFLAHRDFWPQAIDKLHFAIDQAFREAKIEIAFPQRDIHVRSMVSTPEPLDSGPD